MARNFTSGTSFDPGGSADVNAVTLHGLMRNAIIANAAWSLVEEFTSGTADHKVFKCAAASSGLPEDFYMTVTRVATQFLVGVGEQYNTITKVLSNCAMGDTSSSRALTLATGLPTTASTVTLTSSTATVGNGARVRALNCLVSSYYSFAIDADHCTLTITTSSAYVGAFTSLVDAAIADTMPLVIVDLAAASSAVSQTGGVVRHVGMNASPAPLNSWFVDGGLSTDSRMGLVGSSGNGLAFTSSDKMQGGKPHVSEVAVLHSSSNAVLAGYLRGKLKKILCARTPPSGMAVGDTSVIDGTTWQVCAVNGTTSCNFTDTGVL